jgi:hypothetical protein
VVNEIRIYFEGDATLIRGFSEIFKELHEKARSKSQRLRLIATGGTPDHDFAMAKKSHPNDTIFLLKDSEGPLPANSDKSVFWMVEMMESWFYADKDKLAEFYGPGFQRSSLKANPKVEEIPKRDLVNGLKAATGNTNKGAYHKTAHAPKLLERIRPELVRAAAPNCERLFDAVMARLA